MLFFLAEPRAALGDLLVEPLDLDLFLGDDVHVLADLGHQVLNHAPGAVDLELDGHALPHGVGHVAGRRAEIAEDVAPGHQRAQKNHATADDEQFPNHGKGPPGLRMQRVLLESHSPPGADIGSGLSETAARATIWGG